MTAITVISAAKAKKSKRLGRKKKKNKYDVDDNKRDAFGLLLESATRKIEQPKGLRFNNVKERGKKKKK